jgi:LysM repeat protein
MSERKKPNQFARVLAVMALLGAFIVVIVLIASSGSGDSGNKDEASAGQTGQTREGRRALDAGVWVVHEGDTLVSISEATGIDLDQLVALNPDIDPQTLAEGQRISLRAGQAGQSSDSAPPVATVDTTADPADEFGDGSVAHDNGSSGTSTSSP